MNQEPKAWWMKASEPEYTADYLTFNIPTRDQKISHRAIPLYTKPEDRLVSHEEQEEWLRNVRKTGY